MNRLAPTRRCLWLASGIVLLAYPRRGFAQGELSPKVACTTKPVAGQNEATTRPKPISQELPPSGPKRPKGGEYKLTLRITPEGLVDTSAVAVEPALPPSYLAEFKKSFLRFRFEPALRSGCPVVGSFSYTITFY